MTTNEVAYWQLQEQKRNNTLARGNEERDIAERERSNRVNEAIKNSSVRVQERGVKAQEEANRLKDKQIEYTHADEQAKTLSNYLKFW